MSRRMRAKPSLSIAVLAAPILLLREIGLFTGSQDMGTLEMLLWLALAGAGLWWVRRG